jgi:phosphatidylserine/phosphatidylglycerophosphate/cardiolipin synthase-like enzyme
MDEMDEYMNSGFRDSRVRLAHELGNLTDVSVVKDVEYNEDRNPNSIMSLLGRLAEETPDARSVRIVSPYLFLAEYRRKDGTLVRDEAEDFRQWLNDHPYTVLEIITNSVLTSDNFSAQSIIDMSTGPRLLLPPDLRQAWLELKGDEEVDAELVNTAQWQELVDHPRLKVYETGRLDSALLGNGDRNYGKLHAKFLISNDIGFVGTTNFDYRSRLYNNEMGFFFLSDELVADLHAGFDQLVAISYRWGSPEWLQLRKSVMDAGGIKGFSTRHQRRLYKFFQKTGIIWLL